MTESSNKSPRETIVSVSLETIEHWASVERENRRLQKDLDDMNELAAHYREQLALLKAVGSC
jgi:hypothetical protein